MTNPWRGAAVAAFTIMLAASPAFGQQWTAEMVDNEGGPTMMASIAGPGSEDDLPPEIFMFCGGGTISLRYSFPVAADVAYPLDRPVPFTFEFGTGSATLDMQFEEMDAAFAAYIPTDDKIIGLFKSAATVIVDDPTGLYHPQAFPLTGSSDAIDTLIGQCD
jgi:hypothetical protein